MSIEKNVKLAQKFFIVSFIMAVVQISFALFYEFLIKANSTTWSFDYNLICVILIEIVAPLNGMNTKKYYQKYTASLEKKLENLIGIFIFANPLFVFICALINFGFGCFYFLGYTCGLALIFLIIGHIFYVKLFVCFCPKPDRFFRNGRVIMKYLAIRYRRLHLRRSDRGCHPSLF